jgi:transposase
MIPKFDERGNLPPGIHHATWSEIVTRYATSTRRRDLLDGLLDALRSLKAAGCATAYLDGSFVTAKAHPDDFDACWESAGVVPSRIDSFRDYFQYDNVTKQPKGIIAIHLAGLL